MSFWFLSTPYSKFPGGLDAAYRAACEQTALLVRAGIPCFSPIAHTHGIAVHGDIDPTDHAIWLPADMPFMEAAVGMIVCKLPTWECSDGILAEIAAFYGAGKPVVFMEPDELPQWIVTTEGGHA